MVRRIVGVSLLAMLLMFSLAQAQESSQVPELLKGIDNWVTTDTARIMSFIDSSNAISEKMLQSSKYWDPVNRDLSFLLGIDYIATPQIDNTGRIYFMMRLTGESASLFYMDKPMSWPIQITPNNWTEEGFTIHSYSVHPSGDYILVQVNKFGDEMHDIWYFSRDGQFRPLLENRNERYTGVIFDEDNENQFYMFVQSVQGMVMARYNITDGKLDSLYTEPGAFYPTDYANGKLTFVRWFSFSETQLAMFDIATKKVTDLTDTTLIYAAGFMNDGKVILQTTAMSAPDEFMKICTLDPAEPNKYTVLYDPKKATDGFLYLKKRDACVLSVNNDGYSQLVAFDTKGNPLTIPQLPIGVLGGQGAEEISGNDLGDLVCSFSSPTTPLTAFRFKLGGTDLQQIGRVSTFGFDFSNIEVKVIRYKSDGGWEIPALLYTPKNAKMDGSNPAIISYHGGPPSQSRPVFQRNIAYALSKGFVMMFPNVRGSTGYGPAYEQADNLEGRFASLIDCERAIDYLIDQKLSNPAKIAVWGGSYGGYVVDWLATHASQKFACAISMVGVSDPDFTNRNSKNQSFSGGWQREYGPLGSDLVRSLAPIYFADQSTKPILLTAGFNDPRVPPSDPRRFAYVLSQLGKPVYYYEETEAGHGSSMKAQVIHDYTSYYVFTMMHVMQ